MRKVELLRLVVASPGDVQAERDRVADVVAELNRGLADVLGVRLDVVRWETDAYPGFNQAGSQGQIDSSLRIADADLVIGVFWKRFGTPVADAQSGTEHEIRGAYRSWERAGRPQIMVYFNQVPPLNPSSEEAAGWQKVRQFQQDPMFKQGLWWTYTGVPGFEKLVREHLTQFLRHRTTPVEMEVRTVNSLLGLMDVTGVRASQVRADTQITPGLTHYQSPGFGFQIAWPVETWRGLDDPLVLQQFLGQSGSLPTIALALIISYSQPVIGFVPNVNVIVEHVGALSIRNYLEKSTVLGQQVGQQEVTSVADDQTQCGFRAYFADYGDGQRLYQFQRIALSGGNAYITTASQLPPMDLVGLRLKSELGTILNSFRLL